MPASPEPDRDPARRRAMDVGLMLPTSEQTTSGSALRFAELADLAAAAESLGYDCIYVPDHFVYRADESGDVDGVWEAWTLLAGLAARTTSIGLCVFVTGLAWRNPGVVAKMAENLDEISRGRFTLGLGAGSRPPDFDVVGAPFDHRASRAEEATEIISSLLKTSHADFHGQFYQANDAYNLPRGPRADSGGVPILIGTRGPRMLRLTARLADIWNGDWHSTAESVKPLLEEVDTACAEIGRDPATLQRSAGSSIRFDGPPTDDPRILCGTDEEIAQAIQGFRDLGLQHYIARFEHLDTRALERLAPLID